MALLQLYELTTGSLNPSYLTGLQPGGAGVQVAGTQVASGISNPTLETYQREVQDITAPTLITSGKTLGTPAPQGKLLVLDPVNGAFGAKWKLNSAVKQPLGQGAYGIVETAGIAGPNDIATGSSNGNVAVPGSKGKVVIAGPVKAFVQGTVGGSNISAGMPLAADGAGNLTYAGAAPAAGTVLGTYADAPLASTVSIPVLSNCYLGGY